MNKTIYKVTEKTYVFDSVILKDKDEKFFQTKQEANDYVNKLLARADGKELDYCNAVAFAENNWICNTEGFCEVTIYIEEITTSPIKSKIISEYKMYIDYADINDISEDILDEGDEPENIYYLAKD